MLCSCIGLDACDGLVVATVPLKKPLLLLRGLRVGECLRFSRGLCVAHNPLVNLLLSFCSCGLAVGTVFGFVGLFFSLVCPLLLFGRFALARVFPLSLSCCPCRLCAVGLREGGKPFPAFLGLLPGGFVSAEGRRPAVGGGRRRRRRKSLLIAFGAGLAVDLSTERAGQLQEILKS
jgi:hypothetical protein